MIAVKAMMPMTDRIATIAVEAAPGVPSSQDKVLRSRFGLGASMSAWVRGRTTLGGRLCDFFTLILPGRQDLQGTVQGGHGLIVALLQGFVVFAQGSQ